MSEPTKPEPGTAKTSATKPAAARGLGGTGKVALFALGLVVMFGAAYLIGWVASPDTAENSAPHAHRADSSGTQPGGLLIADQGYTLRLLPSDSGNPADSGSPADSTNAGTLAFRIIGPTGATVTQFDTKHDKKLHLIAVRRDLSGFRHVHPEMSPDGVWRVARPFGQGGSYRVFADFTVKDGPALTLGADVHIPGGFSPIPLPPPSDTVTVHGYTVTMDGTLKPGKASTLDFTIAKNGVSVADLQPYLAAYGHLVALREGDLAYLHVHPDGAPPVGAKPGGPRIAFTATAPTPGVYRLFLEFQHNGAVHAAEFTVAVGAASSAGAPTNPAPVPGHDSDHHH